VSGPIVNNPPRLPAGVYRIAIDVLGPLPSLVRLDHDCYVLHAAPFVDRSQQPRVRPVGAATTGPAAQAMSIIMVSAVPVTGEEAGAGTELAYGPVTWESAEEPAT